MIYVLGSGQLASELKQIYVGHDVRFLSRSELDLSNTDALEHFLNTTKISILINAAAYTNVDQAESERDIATRVNVSSPALIAKYATRMNFKFIHFSTDYVFDGKKTIPYIEDDHTCPLNIYGKTKADGEREVLLENPKALIIRTSWLYSSYGKNFVKTIFKLASERPELSVIYDQVGTPTFARDLAEIIPLTYGLEGIYHFSNEGVTSWYDFAHEIIRLKGLQTKLKPILTNEFPSKTRRPEFSVLNKNKIKQALGITIPHWTESLAVCLQEIS